VKKLKLFFSHAFVVLLMGAALVGLGAWWGYDMQPLHTRPCPVCTSVEACEVLGELGRLKLQVQQLEERNARLPPRSRP
jgi:hypothetical protein